MKDKIASYNNRRSLIYCQLPTPSGSLFILESIRIKHGLKKTRLVWISGYQIDKWIYAFFLYLFYIKIEKIHRIFFSFFNIVLDSYADTSSCQSSIRFSSSELSSFTEYSSSLAISTNCCFSIQSSSHSDNRWNC